MTGCTAWGWGGHYRSPGCLGPGGGSGIHRFSPFREGFPLFSVMLSSPGQARSADIISVDYAFSSVCASTPPGGNRSPGTLLSAPLSLSHEVLFLRSPLKYLWPVSPSSLLLSVVVVVVLLLLLLLLLPSLPVNRRCRELTAESAFFRTIFCSKGGLPVQDILM